MLHEKFRWGNTVLLPCHALHAVCLKPWENRLYKLTFSLTFTVSVTAGQASPTGFSCLSPQRHTFEPGARISNCTRASQKITIGEKRLPRNDSHAQEGSQDTEHQSHDTLGREPGRDGWRRLILAFQIGEIICIACCVASGGDLLARTGVKVVLWYLERLLELRRRLDHGGDEAGCDVPFNVAVEQPDTWVICSES